MYRLEVIKCSFLAWLRSDDEAIAIAQGLCESKYF